MLKPVSLIDYVASCSVIDATSTLGTLFAHVLIFHGPLVVIWKLSTSDIKIYPVAFLLYVSVK